MARQTNDQLIAELRKLANLESFASGATITVKGHNVFAHDIDGYHGPLDELVREQTRIYRDTWLAPILDEIERRLVKPAISKADQERWSAARSRQQVSN